jgi:sugar lactone lactonase YvrE
MPFALAYADQGGFTNSGGTLPGGTSVTNPPGTLTITGETMAFRSTDGMTAINAIFSNSSTVEHCSGGGRGGHVTCQFTFTGTFSGTLTVNGSVQGVNGVTYQLYGTNGVVVTGTTGYNSAYSPFYFSNTGQILRSDDLNGTNLISYGTQGSSVGQFYGAYGIAVDSAGRIYVADTYNARIVRIDDMNGANWTSFGTFGSAFGQFSSPSGISIDAAGRIYVMDTGNDRLVRMDDMNGTNWTTFSGIGSGVGQFAQYVAPVAFDASGRIYLADTGNKRIVRMDDMNGTNWTTLVQSPIIGIYIYSFGSPIGVAVDAAGRIHVADAYHPSVIRVDDMTGANWTSISLGSGATPHSIAVDSSGMVLVGGGGVQVVDNMAGVLASSSLLTQYYGPYYVFGATPLPNVGALPVTRLR